MSEETFKFVDKRRFSETGDTRADAPEEEVKPKEAARATPQAQPRAVREEVPADQADQVDFISFIIGLATQTMVMLGEMPHPETNQSMINLEAARQTIDILGVIEEKTKGNLTKDEERLMQDVLANLRLAFVNKMQKK